MWQLPEITDERKSEEFVFRREGKSCVSPGHDNSLCSHHSCGVFMSDGLFCWIRFLGKHLGPDSSRGNTGVGSGSLYMFDMTLDMHIIQCTCLCVCVYATLTLGLIHMRHYWRRGGNPAQQEVVPSDPHTNSHTAVVSITCLLFSADTKSAAPSEPTHPTPADLWMNGSNIISRHLLHMSGNGIHSSFKTRAVMCVKDSKEPSYIWLWY